MKRLMKPLYEDDLINMYDVKNLKDQVNWRDKLYQSSINFNIN